jgi:hypothetical protein
MSTLTNPLTSLPILHFEEAELLFHSAAVRYARIPHEGLRRVCADAGKAMREAEKMVPVPLVGDLVREWMETLEAEKEKWEEEKRARREREKRDGVWWSTKVEWLA